MYAIRIQCKPVPDCILLYTSDPRVCSTQAVVSSSGCQYSVSVHACFSAVIAAQRPLCALSNQLGPDNQIHIKSLTFRVRARIVQESPCDAWSDNYNMGTCTPPAIVCATVTCTPTAIVCTTRSHFCAYIAPVAAHCTRVCSLLQIMRNVRGPHKRSLDTFYIAYSSIP